MIANRTYERDASASLEERVADRVTQCVSIMTRTTKISVDVKSPILTLKRFIVKDSKPVHNQYGTYNHFLYPMYTY
jgi:hypothetical protein